MCFVLYAGTTNPLPQREWRDEAPDVVVTSLDERESVIRVHFTKPEVQYITSTAGCGCDFPYVMSQNGGWPWSDNGEHDPDQDKRDRYNREALVHLLQSTGEQRVELYGVWDGGFDFATPPAQREEISLNTILDPNFRFKEQGFYVVHLPSA